MPGQGGGNHRHQVGQCQLQCRQVDRNRQRPAAGGLPGGILATGFVQHPFTDADDQAGFFSDRDKSGRRNHPVAGMPPADQRFNTKHAAAQRVELWLIVEE